MTATYITTTIPYVNARPHIGHALELVQADVLARYHRGRGNAVRFQAGTDDNALKNVLAAGAAGLGVREFVDRNAEAFGALGGALSLSVDDFIRTSRDPRHRPGVEAFWRACSADLYRQQYTGLYCTGCEQFYVPAELRDGALPRARDRAGTRQRGELVLPAVPVRRAAAGGDHHRPAADRARRAPQRGARAHRRRAAGLLRVAARRPGRRLGHPGARRPGPGRLRVVRRAVQLRNGAGLRPGRPSPWRGLPALVGRTGEPRPPARQGRAAVSRRLLAGHAAGVRAAAADRHLRARLPDRRRQEDQQVRRRRHGPRSWRARAGRAGRGVRRRRGALVAAARGAAGGGRRLHRGAARRPGRRRARQRPGQPGQPGGRHDRPLPGRPAARRARPSRGARR